MARALASCPAPEPMSHPHHRGGGVSKVPYPLNHWLSSLFIKFNSLVSLGSIPLQHNISVRQGQVPLPSTYITGVERGSGSGHSKASSGTGRMLLDGRPEPNSCHTGA